VNILAIETATTSCAIGLATANRSVVVELDHDRHHTEVLTGGIRALLASEGVVVSDLHRVVVDRGPGLFTGLRVGLAAAQALAAALGIELIGVTSLELLARGAWRGGVRGAVTTLVDARRQEVFAQSFTISDDVVPVNEPSVLAASGDVLARRPRPLTITGDGAARYLDVLTTDGSISHFVQSVPSVLDALALGAAREGGATTPLYLREADAVANFSTRQRP
jgi:tRNA threonylcarbamoyladenosine biosynthesis protein TsaB